MNFDHFKTAVAARFDAMSKSDLFCTAVGGDDLWETYLGSFPEGTNPILRERTEHDCNCCRRFIKAVGNVVSVENGKLVSIWDVKVDGEPAYEAVAQAMSQKVKAAAIDNIFLFGEHRAGVEKTHENVDGRITTWPHFSVAIPHARNTGKNYYLKADEIATVRGRARDLRAAFLRSLTEITFEAVDTTLDLIAPNAFDVQPLYRGEENKWAVTAFRKMKAEFEAQPEAERVAWVWVNADKVPEQVAKIRGTAIGTLLTDISEGYHLEDAVASFERKMDPVNFKRTTAPVSQKQVAAAQEKIAELGLTEALERRFARLEDLHIDDILFVDRGLKSVLKGSIFDGIATKAAASKNIDGVEHISIAKFLADIVPRVESIEALVENRHEGNLVSLVAPVDRNAQRMFKWDNGFSWSYKGDVTDAIKERVKAKGGNVTGDLCCRLAWSNFDDLDFHLREPTGEEIFFGHRMSRAGGQLDVDENAGSGRTRTPVENIFYPDRRRMPEGRYVLFVDNFAKRESIDVGFQAQIDFLGNTLTFTYEKALRTGERVVVAEFTYSHKNGIEYGKTLPSTQASKEIWGLKSMDFHRVKVLMNSPNHWGEQGVGNRHVFFMLDGCQNEGQARGFYNEFLRQDLDAHRRVLELVGAKMRTDESAEQLSGLGFSSTVRNTVMVRVKGSFTRTMVIDF